MKIKLHNVEASNIAIGLMSHCGIPSERYGLETMPGFEGRDTATPVMNVDEVTTVSDMEALFAPTVIRKLQNLRRYPRMSRKQEDAQRASEIRAHKCTPKCGIVCTFGEW